MPAYVVVDIQVTDPSGYEDYKKLAPPSISAYGGTYLARGGRTELLKATGCRAGWSSFSSRAWSGPARGWTRRNTARPGSFATRRPSPTWS